MIVHWFGVSHPSGMSCGFISTDAGEGAVLSLTDLGSGPPSQVYTRVVYVIPVASNGRIPNGHLVDMVGMGLDMHIQVDATSLDAIVRGCSARRRPNCCGTRT